MNRLVLCALVTLSVMGGALADGAKQTATIGQTAPTFTLPNVVTGAPTSLSSLEKSGKAVVVIFISTRCPVSNAYNDRMIALANTYASRGVTFVGIDANQTEPTAEVTQYVKDHKFPFAVLKDGDDSAANAYAAQVTPETYVIDSNGVLDYHGRIDNNRDITQVDTHDLANALDEVLAGKPVVKPLTKAFGCSVRRSA